MGYVKTSQISNDFCLSYSQTDAYSFIGDFVFSFSVYNFLSILYILKCYMVSLFVCLFFIYLNRIQGNFNLEFLLFVFLSYVVVDFLDFLFGFIY